MSTLKRKLQIAGILILVSGSAVLISVILVVLKVSATLPSLDAIKNYEPNLVSTVFDRNGKVVASFSNEHRISVPPEEMSPEVVAAFIAAEDDEFFQHRGINPATIIRAAIKNFRAGHTVQGGSTITQQVAKSILLTPERTYTRKAREILLALKIEKTLSKSEILNLYLNHIFLGSGAYGVEAAAQIYFGKRAKELTYAEAAILGGLPRAPSRDNPHQDPEAAKNRQRYVLGRLYATHKITKEQLDQFLEMPVRIANKRELNRTEAPYFSEFVRRYLVKKYGQDLIYGGGLKVHTTVDLELQKIAENAINKGLVELDKRQGLRAPKQNLNAKARQEYLAKQHRDIVAQHYDYKLLDSKGQLQDPVDEDAPTPLDPQKKYWAVLLEKRPSRTLLVQVGNRRGIINPDGYKWVFAANPDEIYEQRIIRNPYNELKVGDVLRVGVESLAQHPVTEGPIRSAGGLDIYRLEQDALVQGSLLSYSVPDGDLLAMVGGYDFRITKSEFNRAVQAVRQPGSTFKPFIYSAALDNGLTASTIVVDSPIVYATQSEQDQFEKVWKPGNYGEKFYGDTTLRNALAFSRNIPTIKLLQHIKIQTAIEYARKLGFKSNLNADLSLALGSSGVTLEELTQATGVFANQGKRLPAHFVSKIVNRNGDLLEQYTAPLPPAAGAADPEQLIPPTTAYLMTSILQSVVQYGTGVAAKALGRPLAAKTGTTNDYKDALFMGYVPQIITGVWTGFDEDRPIGRNETGAQAALPIWLEYMQAATKGLESKEFPRPPGIVEVSIDSETGDLPTPRTRKRMIEFFAEGTAPGQIPPPPVPLPGAPAENPALAKSGPNRTVVVTGNGPSGANSASPTREGGGEEGQGTDELFRNEL